MDVRTYYSDVGPLRDGSLYEKAYRTVSQERREKTDRFVFDKDRRLSLGVELLLFKALNDLSVDLGSITIIRDCHDKPMLKGSDLQFNLSHSGERVMCSVSDQDVGCDVELIAPIDLNVARDYFYGSEYDVICRYEGEERFRMFYRFWTLKESFMKATGLGLSLELDKFSITLGEDIGVQQNIDDRIYRFKEYAMDDGYCYSVCSVKSGFEARMRGVDLRNLLRNHCLLNVSLFVL